MATTASQKDRYSWPIKTPAGRGSSASERSDLQAIRDAIHPYVEQTLGEEEKELVHGLDKSKFRRIVPLLRVLIDPKRAGTTSVQEQVKEVQKRAKKEGVDPVQWLLHCAAAHPLVDLDGMLRGHKPLPIRGFARGDMVTLIISEDELADLEKWLGKRVEFEIDREPDPV